MEGQAGVLKLTNREGLLWVWQVPKMAKRVKQARGCQKSRNEKRDPDLNRAKSKSVVFNVVQCCFGLRYDKTGLSIENGRHPWPLIPLRQQCLRRHLLRIQPGLGTADIRTVLLGRMCTWVLGYYPAGPSSSQMSCRA